MLMKNSIRLLLVSIPLALCNVAIADDAKVARATAPRPFTPLKLGTLRGLAIDQADNIYIADTPSHTIRKMTPDGTVTTVAGKTGEAGFVDGPTAEARFDSPRAAALDSAGNLYVADSNHHAVRMISPDGRVTTVAGVLPPPSAAPAGSK